MENLLSSIQRIYRGFSNTLSTPLIIDLPELDDFDAASPWLHEKGEIERVGSVSAWTTRGSRCVRLHNMDQLKIH